MNQFETTEEEGKKREAESIVENEAGPEEQELRNKEIEEARRLEDTKNPLIELAAFVKRVREYWAKFGKK
ncbi:MAG: hypothetical protein ACM3KM_04150 [Acidobacteriaceae bacterium]